MSDDPPKGDFLSAMLSSELETSSEGASTGSEPRSDPHLEVLQQAAATPKGLALEAGSPDKARSLRFRIYRARERFRRQTGSTSLDGMIVQVVGDEVHLKPTPPFTIRRLLS